MNANSNIDFWERNNTDDNNYYLLIINCVPVTILTKVLSHLTFTTAYEVSPIIIPILQVK